MKKDNHLGTVLVVLSLLLMTGCQPQSITRNLEALPLDAEAQAMIQVMEEYQASAVERYSYPIIGPWMSVNRTASIRGADSGEVVVFTRNESGSLEWRDVQYVYPFYEEIALADGKESGEEPLLVAPLALSPDGEAVAYQSLHSHGRFLEIAEMGKTTVLVGGDGRVYSADSSLEQVEELSWDALKFDWSSDGQFLLFYRADDWGSGWNGDGEIELEIDVEEEPQDSVGQSDAGQNGAPSSKNQKDDKGVVLTVGDIYGYDRGSGQVSKIWEAMRLNLPAEKVSDPEVVADAAEGCAAMFLLFDEEAECLDIQMWNQNGVPEIKLVSLPQNPCIQMNLDEGVYYYQENGDIWKAPLGKSGQSQLVLTAGTELQAFLISEDERQIFTIEQREETEDICLYLQDEKGSWYKQAIAVGTKGACSLQLSDDQQRLLVECQTENENQALIIHFISQEDSAK